MLVFWVFRNEGKAAMSDNGIKPTENADTRFVTIRAETWRALLEIAGRQIDPESAEVHWCFRQVVDPYGVYPDLPPECDCVGRCFFARAPGSLVWIEFGDLPEATREALWMRVGRLPSLIDNELPF
jgi:hypothetical protein